MRTNEEPADQCLSKWPRTLVVNFTRYLPIVRPRREGARLGNWRVRVRERVRVPRYSTKENFVRRRMRGRGGFTFLQSWLRQGKELKS